MHAIAHGGCTNAERESALKADSGILILCRTGDSNLRQYCSWLLAHRSTNWVALLLLLIILYFSPVLLRHKMRRVLRKVTLACLWFDECWLPSHWVAWHLGRSQVLRSLKHCMRISSHHVPSGRERDGKTEIDDRSWKGERGPSWIRLSAKLFQRQRWGNFWETVWSESVFPHSYHTELTNCDSHWYSPLLL